MVSIRINQDNKFELIKASTRKIKNPDPNQSWLQAGSIKTSAGSIMTSITINQDNSSESIMAPIPINQDNKSDLIKASITINHDFRSNQSLSNPNQSWLQSGSIKTPDPNQS
jgi:hypothetical protein